VRTFILALMFVAALTLLAASAERGLVD